MLFGSATLSFMQVVAYRIRFCSVIFTFLFVSVVYTLLQLYSVLPLTSDAGLCLWQAHLCALGTLNFTQQEVMGTFIIYVTPDIGHHAHRYSFNLAIH